MSISYLFSYFLMFVTLISCSGDEIQEIPASLRISSQGDIDIYCDQYRRWQSRITINCTPEMNYSCLEPIKESNDVFLSGTSVSIALQHFEEIGNHGGYGLSITDTDDETLSLPNLRIVNDIAMFGTNKFKSILAPQVVEAEKVIFVSLCRSLESIIGYHEVKELEVLNLYVLGGQQMVIDGFQKLEKIDLLRLNIEHGSLKLDDNALGNIKEINNYLYITDEEGGFDISPIINNLEVLKEVLLSGNISKEQLCQFERFFADEEFELKLNQEVWSLEELQAFCE